MIPFLIAIVAGIGLGILMGMTPSIHPNLVAPSILLLNSNEEIIFLLISSLVTYRFFVFVRSTFLFIPDESNVLALHPIYKLVREGKGLVALKLITAGCLTAVLVGIFLSPALTKVIPIIYNFLEEYIPFLLLGLITFLVIKDNNSLGAIAVLGLSGLIGYYGLQILSHPLTVLLSGFFAFPILLQSKGEIPKQLSAKSYKVSKERLAKGVSSSFFASFILTFLPAIGPSQASLVTKGLLKDVKEFIISIGAIGGFDIIFSTTFLLSIGKSRVGVLEISKKYLHFDQKVFIAVLMITFFVGIISYFLSREVGRSFSKLTDNLDYKKVKIGVLVTVTCLVGYLDQVTGLAFLASSAMIGLLCSKMKVRMTNCMGSLVVPIIGRTII